MANNMYTANRRLYLDKDGKVVEADNPARVSLLVAEGGTIPMADAERHGLITPSTEGEKIKAAPEANKAKAPRANK